ncbi:hypothetical protein SmJEL517_g03659 [Synchytrium microbalum]|uniref:Protein kinase domain-containing protein n=1 Tax=Synchytrium microbalum TaxID=1806994 RepID=A0A507C176_9FUNG|nr:uncharacterized protein SmJEL517_g03659 [Synchytrium microbalum]TPX33452.1 hypothetical protein SmJEL517_g03659 [Synchytrium microbalum]
MQQVSNTSNGLPLSLIIERTSTTIATTTTSVSNEDRLSPAPILNTSALPSSSTTQRHGAKPSTAATHISLPEIPSAHQQQQTKIRTRRRCCLVPPIFTYLWNWLPSRTEEERIRIRIDRRASGRTIVRTRLLNKQNATEDDDTVEWDDEVSFFENEDKPPIPVRQSREMTAEEEAAQVFDVFEKACKQVPVSISSTYRFRGLLGWGGNAFVAEAQDINTSEYVAIKFIQKSRLDEMSLLEGVPLEAVVLRAIQHPNIVAFRAIYSDDTYYYLIINRSEPLTWRLGQSTSEDVSPTEMLSLQPKSIKRYTATPRDSIVNEAATKIKRRSAYGSAQRASIILRQSPPRSSVMSDTVTPPRGSLSLEIAPVIPQPTPAIVSQPTAAIVSIPPIAAVSTPPAAAIESTSSPLGRPRHSHQGDLIDFLTMFGKTPPRVIRHLVLQLVSAYQALLNAGYVYLDFRPENVLISDSLHLILVDFGMSQPILTNNDDLFSQYGTVEASAPEILAGKGYRGSEADIWAMGLVVYLICSGGESAFGSRGYRAGTNIEFPVDMEQEYRDLLSNMLEVDPVKRFNISAVAYSVKSWSVC